MDFSINFYLIGVIVYSIHSCLHLVFASQKRITSSLVCRLTTASDERNIIAVTTQVLLYRSSDVGGCLRDAFNYTSSQGNEIVVYF